jgi:hypothetical protein
MDANAATPIERPQGPLTPLYEFHRRALAHCRSLRRLVLYTSECGCDREAQVVANELLRFFDNEVPYHYLDEEEDLYPALIESMAGSDATCLRELTRGSHARHRRLWALWDSLRTSLERIAAGVPTVLSAQVAEAFVSGWEENVSWEEGELLAMAPRLITDGELARIGRSMEERHA